MVVLYQQYPAPLFTSTYLTRSTTIGFIRVQPPQAHLPEAPQQVDFLVGINCIGQAVDDQVHRGGSQGGTYGS